jgi:hypothetical protein
VWEEFDVDEGEYPDRFKFLAVGDSISGEIIDVGIIKSDYGRTPKVTIKTEDAPMDVFLSQTQLQRKMAKLKPGIGDSVSITFTGTEDRGSGRTLKLFEVKVNAEAPASAPAEAAEPVDADELV